MTQTQEPQEANGTPVDGPQPEPQPAEQEELTGYKSWDEVMPGLQADLPRLHSEAIVYVHHGTLKIGSGDNVGSVRVLPLATLPERATALARRDYPVTLRVAFRNRDGRTARYSAVENLDALPATDPPTPAATSPAVSPQPSPPPEPADPMAAIEVWERVEDRVRARVGPTTSTTGAEGFIPSLTPLVEVLLNCKPVAELTTPFASLVEMRAERMKAEIKHMELDADERRLALRERELRLRLFEADHAAARAFIAAQEQSEGAPGPEPGDTEG